MIRISISHIQRIFKGITTPSIKYQQQRQHQIGSIMYIVTLGMGMGPILKRHHRPALLTLTLQFTLMLGVFIA